MPIPIIEAKVSDETRAAVAEGWALYEKATLSAGNLLELLAQDDADRMVLDHIIAAFAAQGGRFSANDIRKQLPPGVRKALISRRLIHAQREGLIEHVGYTSSTLKSTKAAKVHVYRKTKRDARQAVAS